MGVAYPAPVEIHRLVELVEIHGLFELVETIRHPRPGQFSSTAPDGADFSTGPAGIERLSLRRRRIQA
jgi:hypothetical protein